MSALPSARSWAPRAFFDNAGIDAVTRWLANLSITRKLFIAPAVLNQQTERLRGQIDDFLAEIRAA